MTAWICVYCGTSNAPTCRHYYTKSPSSVLGPRPASTAAPTPGRTSAVAASGRDMGGAL